MEEEWVGYDGGVVQEWHRNASQIQVDAGVLVIPERAFAECENLRAVDLSNVATISDQAFDSCRSLEHIIWTAATTVEIGEQAFALCTGLTKIDLSNATKIGEAAFKCTALERVTVPPSVDEIEGWAFERCGSLTNVELSEGIQRIERAAFMDCSALVRITIPASVTVIGASAFYGCNSLREVKLKEGLQHIEGRAFQGSSLASINIPSTVLKVGDDAFAFCDSLVEVDLNEGLQGIEQVAFLDCSSLERITIPSSVTVVGSWAFAGCTSLAVVTLHEGVQCIGKSAFDGCPLQHINIPPVALVANIERLSCQVMRGAMPTPRDRTIVASKWMQYRSQSQLAEAKAKVNEILGRQQTDEKKIRCIREWFAYYCLLDVTTLLELAIWRANVNSSEMDADARKAIRQNCGSDMNIIILGILRFLEE